MGVAYSGISSGSALFARWKQSLRTEVHLFVEILTSSPLRRKKRLFCACGHPSKMEGVKINCS